MRVGFGATAEATVARVRTAAVVELSRVVPLLESVGFAVVAHRESREDGEAVHEFTLRPAGGVLAQAREPAVGTAADGERLAAAVEACWHGWCDVDGLNALVLGACVPWSDVAVLRAYRHYHRHLDSRLSGATIDAALRANPAVAAQLLDYFWARFGDAADSEAAQAGHARVMASCDAVERLDHDEALRRVLRLMEATVATNAAATSQPGEPPPLALTLRSAHVPDLPAPVPFREIFVLSPQLEGIHLRGGPVARGGIRWSERSDDLRDEVLGLLKAQLLKNALIVPTGAKGGFLLRRRPEDPPELPARVREAYLAFVGALLDVTGADDPYLVVAPDKGTAAFSDLANDLALRRGFWLGDAFASGGSRGYDHKALGITARGAWCAAGRHLKELGIQPGRDEITVVGIGDLSGDVFGSGMTRVGNLRLVAAFDHRDIFLDPDPDPAAALAERRRLQALLGSTWQSYDRSLLSEGGGVFPRTLKRIELSEQVRALLRVDAEALTPAQLIRAILQAPVDLLFAGGIGTYVRARGERDEQIGDRANDDVRIQADDLRARVYCEGANLSITQAARIQYARRGGRVNQDAIDNAAGVAISDREVNAKILLSEVAGCDAEESGRLLAACAEEVVDAVLEDVALQSECLSAEQRAGAARALPYERLMAELEATGRLDRAEELLPSSAEMASRAERGVALVRPELATLLAHAKRRLTAAVADSAVPDHPALSLELRRYFAPALVERAGDALGRHPLRRELVATRVANDLVNRLGVTFAFDLAAETGEPLASVAGAYWVARELVGATRWWTLLRAREGALGLERTAELEAVLDGLVAALVAGLLADPGSTRLLTADVGAVAERDGPGFAALREALPSVGTSRRRHEREAEAARLREELGDAELATLLAGARELAFAPEILRVARDRRREPADVAEAFFVLGEQLGTTRLARLLERVEAPGEWASRQRRGLMEDLGVVWRAAVGDVFEAAPGARVHQALRGFLDSRAAPLESAREVLSGVEREERPELDMLAVAIRALRRAVAVPEGRSEGS